MNTFLRRSWIRLRRLVFEQPSPTFEVWSQKKSQMNIQGMHPSILISSSRVVQWDLDTIFGIHTEALVVSDLGSNDRLVADKSLMNAESSGRASCETQHASLRKDLKHTHAQHKQHVYTHICRHISTI